MKFKKGDVCMVVRDKGKETKRWSSHQVPIGSIVLYDQKYDFPRIKEKPIKTMPFLIGELVKIGRL